MCGHLWVDRGSRPAAVAVLAGICLLVQAPLSRADRAIVVFGSAVNTDGTPSPSLLRRLDTALSLARRDDHARVVVSGGSVVGPRAEGPFMARWLASRGVAPKRIIVESRARHTGENASLVVPLLKKARANSVILVTEQYHMRRARFHMRAALKDHGMRRVEVRPCPAPDGRRGLTRLSGWIKESSKIVRDAGFRAWARVRRHVKRPPRRAGALLSRRAR